MHVLIGGAALALASDAKAGTFSSDFNNGVEYPAYLNGAAYWDAVGGVGDSGVVHLTDAFNSQIGTMILEDIDGGAEITGFTARFKILDFGSREVVLKVPDEGESSAHEDYRS